MWFDPGLAGLFITSTLLHLGEDINLLVVSSTPYLSYENMIIIIYIITLTQINSQPEPS